MLATTRTTTIARRSTTARTPTPARTPTTAWMLATAGTSNTNTYVFQVLGRDVKYVGNPKQ